MDLIPISCWLWRWLHLLMLLMRSADDVLMSRFQLGHQM